MLLYNFKTEDEIKYGMLQKIKNTVDKSENSIVHDAVGPAAVEFQNAYVELDYVGGKINPENLEGLELEDYVYQNANIVRKEATYSTGEVVMNGAVGTMVNIGTLVSTGDLDFVVDENKQIGEDGTVTIKVECREFGSAGNVPADSIIKFPVVVSGLNSVTNPSAITNGYDDEDYRLMLDRYYEKVRNPITSANIYHYLLWAKEVEGVGNARVIPRWRRHESVSAVKSVLDSILEKGSYSDEDADDLILLAMQRALSVKTVIIDSNKQDADEGLIEEVQEHIDPNIAGLGEGKAPIGAFCTVVSATQRPINISVKVTSDDSPGNVKSSIEEVVKEYLSTIAFEKTLISYAQIGCLLLGLDSVKDYTELLVNDGMENIRVADDEVAVVGEVIVDEQT